MVDCFLCKTGGRRINKASSSQKMSLHHEFDVSCYSLVVPAIPLSCVHTHDGYCMKQVYIPFFSQFLSQGDKCTCFMQYFHTHSLICFNRRMFSLPWNISTPCGYCISALSTWRFPLSGMTFFTPIWKILPLNDDFCIVSGCSCGVPFRMR